MYCSTCGARIAEGRSGCDTCGAPAPRAPGHALAQAGQGPSTAVAGAVTCPRCGFHGLGIGYFSQAGPLAGALILALFTLPFMGAGGILYYALRHDYRVCPRCAENWGKRGARALALRPPERTPQQLAAETEAAFPKESGVPWPAWILFAFAALMIVIGFAEPEAGMVIVGALAGGGGAAIVRKVGMAREERRQALLTALQQPVLRLAGERGGRLTVTQVATAFSWPIPRAEKVLNSLEDGLRVASDVTDEGVIVYEFRELMHAPRARQALSDPLLRTRSGPPGDEGTLPA